MLVRQPKTGRLMVPRPAKIEAETLELFQTGVLAASAGEHESTLMQNLRDFADLHLTQVPDDTCSTKGAMPATCRQVEEAFFSYVNGLGNRAVTKETCAAVLRRVYVLTIPTNGKRTFTVNKTSVRSFYRVTDHGASGRQVFKTALMLKGDIATSLAGGGSSSSSSSSSSVVV